jgi:hypothetical protein
MATGKKPDPRRKKTHSPHATYLNVKNGEKHGAYKAGELYGCYTHRTHACQPCVSDITDDALECPFCKSGMIPEWRGYVPLWDRDWTLRYVLIGEEFFATTDVIAWHAKVSVSRAKNPISPLVIREEAMLTRDLPNALPWKAEVSALAICLTLWKHDALNHWMSETKPLAWLESLGVKYVTPDAEVKPEVKPTVVVNAYVPPASEAATEVDYEAVKNRLKGKLGKLKPSTNGKHYKPAGEK